MSPTTIDGPSREVLDFGGVAMAADGSGGLVYIKAVGGVSHVFAARYTGGNWSEPIRVDWGGRFEASRPRITAGNKGELIVTWISPIATVDGKIRRALYSARIGPGANQFGSSLLVDPNLGEAKGVEPSLSTGAPGTAFAAYEVITEEFVTGLASQSVQLRPGDVMAEVRVAHLSGGRWSRLGAVNRNPAASMRPPTTSNAPQVSVGATGNAVVAWQEPDASGAARIWERRIFGTTLGSPFQVSPSTWEEKPIVEDADSFALDVTPTERTVIASHIAASASSALGGPRVFLSTMGSTAAVGSGVPTPPQLVGGIGAGPLGASSIATVDAGGGQGRMLLAYLAGGELHEFAANEQGAVTTLSFPPGPPAEAGVTAAVAVEAEGGGFAAYPATDGNGQPAIAVRQQFPAGEAQTGLLSGVKAGPVAELSVARSGLGDGLVGFRQGEPGNFEIVAARVTTPPSSFQALAPSGWVPPAKARLHWGAAETSTGGVSYAVFIDGRQVESGLHQLSFKLSPALVGSGVLNARVMATDAIGSQMLSKPVKLRVDGQPPIARAHLDKGAKRVTVGIRDADSGLRRASTKVNFGDGSRSHGGASFHHVYSKPGAYTVSIEARDRVGNRLAERLKVRIR